MTQTTIQSNGYISTSKYLTVASFKEATILQLPDYPDSTLLKYVNKAQEIMDNWLGKNIGFNLFTDENIRCMYDYPKNGLAIQLPRRNIHALKSITVTFGAKSTLSWVTSSRLSNWRVNKDIGYIEYFGLSLSDYVLNVCLRDPMASNIVPMATVSYYAGYIDIPNAVFRAGVILTEQLIRNERGDDIEITSIAEGNYREGYRRSAGIKSMGKVGGTDQVERLLRPYRQPGQTMFTNGPYG